MERKRTNEHEDATPDDGPSPELTGEDTAADAAVGAVAETDATPALWQELELDESYAEKDAAEIARDLRRQQRESEQAFVKQRADAELAAFQYANQSIQQSPEWQQYQKYLADQQQANKEPAKKWYDRPDFDPSILEDYRIVNEDGTKGAVDRKSLAAAGLLDKALAYQQFLENHDGRWERDREGYLNEFLDHALPDRFAKWEKEAKARWEEERDWAEWDRSNGDWMYVYDGDPAQGGKRIIDPNTGRWALSQEGLTFHQLYNELRQEGVTNSRAARDRATQIMLGIFAAQQGKAVNGHPQPSGEPAKPKGDKHLDHIRKVASRSAGRGGSLTSPEVPNKEKQVRRKDWLDTATENFKHRIGLNSGA